VFSFASAHPEQPRCLPAAKAGMKGRPECRIVCAAPRLRAEDTDQFWHTARHCRPVTIGTAQSARRATTLNRIVLNQSDGRLLSDGGQSRTALASKRSRPGGRP
jgi:hypothetical protein